MEALVRYVSRNNSIQDYIIASDDEKLLEATYKLFLHYNCSLEYFLKAAFRQTLKEQGTESIFRQNLKINNIFSDFWVKYGGTFDVIADRVVRNAIRYKAYKSTRGLKRAAHRAIKLIDKTFASLISESFIDFCTDVCVCLNTLEANTGEDIVGSFICFRVISVKIMHRLNNENRTKVVPLIKLLNKIASGNTIGMPSSLCKFISEHNQIYRRIIARALMRRRDASYCYHSLMEPNKYNEMADIFKEALTKLRDEDKSVRTRSYQNNPVPPLNIPRDKEHIFHRVNLSSTSRSPSPMRKSRSLTSSEASPVKLPPLREINCSNSSSQSPIFTRKAEHSSELCTSDEAENLVTSLREYESSEESSVGLSPPSGSRLRARQNLSMSYNSSPKERFNSSVSRLVITPRSARRYKRSSSLGAKSNPNSERSCGSKSNPNSERSCGSNSRLNSERSYGSKSNPNSERSYGHGSKRSPSPSPRAEEWSRSFAGKMSLNHLLNEARRPCRVTSVADNLRYLILWSTKDILNLVSRDETLINFFKTWNIDGFSFLQLNESNLQAMGMTSSREITNVMELIEDAKLFCIHDIKALMDISITEWSYRDVSLWLTLSNIPHLVDIFLSHNIDGSTLQGMGLEDLRYIGVTRPSDILKITQLQKYFKIPLIAINDSIDDSEVEYSSFSETSEVHSARTTSDNQRRKSIYEALDRDSFNMTTLSEEDEIPREITDDKNEIEDEKSISEGTHAIMGITS